MPTKEKSYERVIFTQDVISKAVILAETTLPKKERVVTDTALIIRLPSGEEWDHDNEEEFFADYQKDFEMAWFTKSFNYAKGKIHIFVHDGDTTASVTMPSRADVEKVFNVLEANVENCRLPEPPPEKPKTKKRRKPKLNIFIGHGNDPQWKELKDHLHEKHKLNVEAYEIGARAGLTIQEVLDEMLTSSSFALLVLTGEDQDASGHLHARENVIHEVGLFQGYLGWRRAVVLLEEGVGEFSNIKGLNQIRFKKGNILITVGEILATIKREFIEK